MKNWGAYSPDSDTHVITCTGSNCCPVEDSRFHSLTFTVKTHYEGLTEAIARAILDAEARVIREFLGQEEADAVEEQGGQA